MESYYPHSGLQATGWLANPLYRLRGPGSPQTRVDEGTTFTSSTAQDERFESATKVRHQVRRVDERYEYLGGADSRRPNGLASANLPAVAQPSRARWRPMAIIGSNQRSKANFPKLHSPVVTLEHNRAGLLFIGVQR